MIRVLDDYFLSNSDAYSDGCFWRLILLSAISPTSFEIKTSSEDAAAIRGGENL